MPKQPKPSPQVCLHPLDPKFVGPKPIEKAPDAVFYKLEQQMRLIIERKRNGHCGYTTITGSRKNNVELYSRSVHDWTAKFPSIIDEIRSMNIPTGTLLGGEGTVRVKGVDSPVDFARFSLSNPERAIEEQKKFEPVQFSFFNVLVYKGKSVIGYRYEDRLDILRNLVARQRLSQVGLVEMPEVSFEAAKELSRKNKWEGLVLYDKDAGSEFRIDGSDSVPRPTGCWKWKDYFSDDFAVISCNISSSGSTKGLVRDVNLAQRDRKTGAWINCGKFSALTKGERAAWLDPSLYPFVMELSYTERTANNKLLNKARVRIRAPEDKRADECLMPE